MSAEMGSEVPADTPSGQARRLLRSARSGCLATSARGQPFASLVTPACMPDGSLLLLLSRLSEHSRHLMADARCSIMVSGLPDSINPQTAPRVTVTGLAKAVDDKALKARFLAVHPYVSLYADFSDFSTWRIMPAAGMLVGGFARAFRLQATADRGPMASVPVQGTQANIGLNGGRLRRNEGQTSLVCHAGNLVLRLQV